MKTPEEIIDSHKQHSGIDYFYKNEIIAMMEEYRNQLINTPEVEDFMNGVKIEAVHQTEKWGADHEESKYPHDYSLVLDKLKGKQALAIWDRNIEKYKHHLITMAAVCHNIHRQIDKPGTNIHHFFNPERP